MIENSLRIFKGLAVKRYTKSKPPRKLIGALGKPDYITPADDKWRHDDSQFDDEGPELKKRMVEKFGRTDTCSSDSDSDGDDEGGDAGAGAVGVSGDGALSAGAAGGTSAGNDEEDTESDDNPPEPGYEYYLDKRGVKKVRKIRRDDDDDDEYVHSDTEVKRLKKKQTVVRRKKKAKKNIGSSSVQQSVPQQEPSQEAEMDPILGFTATEVSDMVPSPPRSSKPAPVVSSTPETPQAPARSIASTIRATTSQPTAEHRQTIFS
ncbi:hypothetical protein Hanom_Chr13g01212371 [Helianthus anomalus]